MGQGRSRAIPPQPSRDLQPTHQPRGDAEPSWVFKNLLLGPRAQRQNLQAPILPPNQPPKDISACRTRDEDIAIERNGKTLRRYPITPNFIPGAIIPNACLNDHSNLARAGKRCGHQLRMTRGRGAFCPQNGSDWQIRPVWQLDKVCRRNVQRRGNAIEPIN